MISPAIAAKAYAAVQAQAQAITDEASGGPAAAAPGGSSFGDILKGVVNGAIESSKTAEKQITLGVQGKADLVDVVTAISSAETSLETVMAVRDQVIAAYQQVMQMQI
jgi:flagellar hook-basal body complex protein FliE